jgi:hypothetical protein
VTKSYGAAFELFIAVLIVGVIASYSCRPYATERARMIRPVAKPIPARA